MTTPENFLNDIKEAVEIHRRMTEEASPYRDEVFCGRLRTSRIVSAASSTGGKRTSS